jgi:Holliday junction resolvasome RuvABC DNA-binding subunit
MTKVGQIILDEINEAVAAEAAKSSAAIAAAEAKAAEAEAQAAEAAAAAALESLGFMARAGVHESDLKLYAQIHSISDADYEQAVRT